MRTLTKRKRLDANGAAARPQAESLTSFAKASAQLPPGDLAQDPDRKVGLDRVPLSVDFQTHLRIHKDGYAASRALERAAPPVSSRKRGLNAAARGISLDTPSGPLDVDAASRAVSVDIPAHLLEPDGTAARMGVDNAIPSIPPPEVSSFAVERILETVIPPPEVSTLKRVCSGIWMSK